VELQVSNLDCFDYCWSSLFFSTQADVKVVNRTSGNLHTKRGVADCSQSRCCFRAHDLISRLQAGIKQRQWPIFPSSCNLCTDLESASRDAYT